ncbi:MAG TPA: glycogen-binding domain-containing protein [Gemmatimonadaceae bacterium]
MHRLALTGFLLVAMAVRGRCQAAGVADGFLDLGGALLSQSNLSNGVLTASGQLRYLTPQFALTMNGIAARTPNDLYSGQGVLSASRYAAPSQRLRWELGGMASAFGLSNAAPSLGWQLLAREHFTGSLGGVFLGAAGGAVTQSNVSRRVLNAHTGGYVFLDPLGHDELSIALAFTDAGMRADTGLLDRYGDAIGYWTHRNGPVELLLGGGLRAVSIRQSQYQSWGSASIVLWFARGAALVFAGGQALEDASRGVPTTRYLSVAMRFGTSSARPGLVTSPVRDRPDMDGGRIDVNVRGDSVRIVTVRLRSAKMVELMADFTDWEPVNMSQVPNGDWTIERIIARGTHRVAIRVDGGAWGVPPNLPRVSDEFGGDVGLLVVP